MEVAEAITRAKAFVRQIYADEDVSQLRLEEVEFDGDRDVWLITLGILRPSIRKQGFGGLSPAFAEVPLTRTYKRIEVPSDGLGVPKMKMRFKDDDDD